MSNFSISCSFSRTICEKAKQVIVEVNPNLPRCLGWREESVHVGEVDHIVEAHWPIPQLPPRTPNEIDQKVIHH